MKSEAAVRWCLAQGVAPIWQVPSGRMDNQREGSGRGRAAERSVSAGTRPTRVRGARPRASDERAVVSKMPLLPSGAHGLIRQTLDQGSAAYTISTEQVHLRGFSGNL